jgi:hypothetical protein
MWPILWLWEGKRVAGLGGDKFDALSDPYICMREVRGCLCQSAVRLQEGHGARKVSEDTPDMHQVHGVSLECLRTCVALISKHT